MLCENKANKSVIVAKWVVLGVMVVLGLLVMSNAVAFAQAESELLVPRAVAEEVVQVKHFNALTVKSVAQLVALGHPDLASAQWQVQAAEALQKKAESGLYPHLTYRLSARAYNNELGLEGVKMDGRRFDRHFQGDRVYGGTLSLDYTLIDWGQTHYSIDAAQHEKMIRQEKIRYIKQRALRDALDAYYTLVSAKESQHYLAVALKELQDFSLVAHRDHRMGKANASQKDIISIELEIAKMSVWTDTLQRWAEDARQSLAYAIGQPDALLSVAADRILYEAKLVSFEYCLQTALANRPELQMLADRYAELEARAQAQRYSNWPQVNIVAQGNYAEDDYAPSPNSSAVVGVYAKGVLFDGFKNNATNQALKADAQAVKKELQALRGHIRQEVGSAWQGIRTTFSSIEKYQQTRNLSLDRLNKVRKGYALQLSDVDDVLEAMVDRRMRDKDYLFAKLQLMQAVVHMNQVCSVPVYSLADNRDQLIKPQSLPVGKD